MKLKTKKEKWRFMLPAFQSYNASMTVDSCKQKVSWLTKPLAFIVKRVFRLRSIFKVILRYMNMSVTLLTLFMYSLLSQVSLVSAESFDNINARQLFTLVGSWRVSINALSQSAFWLYRIRWGLSGCSNNHEWNVGSAGFPLPCKWLIEFFIFLDKVEKLSQNVVWLHPTLFA